MRRQTTGPGWTATLGGVVAGLAVAAPAPAMDMSAWGAVAGARASLRPSFEGSSAHSLYWLPTLSIRRLDQLERFTAPDGGLSLGLLSTDAVVAGPIVRLRHNLESHDPRTGQDSVAVTAEPGGFVDVWARPWLRLRAEMRYVGRGGRGVAGDLGADFTTREGPWDLAVGPRLSLRNGRYLDDRGGFQHGSYVRSVGASAAAAYHLGSRWIVTFDGSYRRLARSALPMVGDPSRGQVSTGLGISYRLGPLGR